MTHRDEERGKPWVRGRLTTIAPGAAAVVLVAAWCLVLGDLQPFWVGEDVVAALALAARR